MRYSDLTESSSYNALLNKILDALRASPFASSTFIFGSIAAGKANPGDVDAVVVIDDNFKFDPVADTQFDAEKLRPLISIVRQFPNGSVDIFLKFNDALLVRSDDGCTFVYAKNAKAMWRDMQATMKPLSEISDLIVDA